MPCGAIWTKCLGLRMCPVLVEYVAVGLDARHARAPSRRRRADLVASAAVNVGPGYLAQLTRIRLKRRDQVEALGVDAVRMAEGHDVSREQEVAGLHLLRV